MKNNNGFYNTASAAAAAIPAAVPAGDNTIVHALLKHPQLMQLHPSTLYSNLFFFPSTFV